MSGVELLQREPSITADIDEQMATRSYNELGYTGLKGMDIAKKIEKAIGRTPFTPESVLAYKNKGLNMFGNWSLADVFGFVLWSVLSVAMLTLSWFVVGRLGGNSTAYLLTSAAVAVINVVTYASGIGAFYASIVEPWLGARAWVRRTLQDCNNAWKPDEWSNRRGIQQIAPLKLPEFVLASALAVKDMCAENNLSCRLYVDQLTPDQLYTKKMQPVELDMDPFLVVVIDGTDYFIEVWNEPKYRQQRMV